MWKAWVACAAITAGAFGAGHSVVVEAEHMEGVRGSNFSFQQVEKTTKGAWAIAGPGVAAEWTMGGESEFMSIAARADEGAGAVCTREVDVPGRGVFRVWVRYGDYRGKKEEFGVRVRQGERVREHVFGGRAVVDEMDPMKLFWDWSFGWDSFEVELERGRARVELFTTGATEARRQVDLVVITTDASYKPVGREKPDSWTWKRLREMGKGRGRRLGEGRAVAGAWKVSGGPPRFVWNVGEQWMNELKKGEGGIQAPFGVDPPLEKAFVEAFKGGKEVPIFGHALSGPAWHIPKYPEIFAEGSPFTGWMERNPARHYAMMLNYAEPGWKKQGADAAHKKAVHGNFSKYNDRFLGFIAGESFAHAPSDHGQLLERAKKAKTRAEVLEAYREVQTASVVKKYSDYFGREVTGEEAWPKNISCLSANQEAFAHALAKWGCERVGHENTGNSPTLARRLGFLRGAARQFGRKFADYQSANLGDSATMFSDKNYFYGAQARYILDNSYDAFAGAGINWLMKDYLLFHLAGVDLFYNEQGIDMFWKPGGHAAGDGFPVQLSPKGKVAEAMLKYAAGHERGHQYTPVAILLDEAHGWSQERFSPMGFGLDAGLNEILRPGKHEASIRGVFDVAYWPGPETQNEMASGVRQTYVSGIWGDIFDVIVASPGHAGIVKTYGVVVLAGEVPISGDWGRALAEFVEGGGTVVVCAGQVSGEGVGMLGLPSVAGAGEANAYEWKGVKREAGVFRYEKVVGGDVLGKVGEDAVVVRVKRGKGRVVYVGVELGLGVDRRPAGLMAEVVADVVDGVMPVVVEGDVEWVVNRLEKGWTVTVINNRGVIKPQHGILPTDHAAVEEVVVRVKGKVEGAKERSSGEAVKVEEKDGESLMRVRVPAGVFRAIEWR